MIESFYNKTIAFLKKETTGAPLFRETWAIDIVTTGMIDLLTGRNAVRDEQNAIIADTFLGCPVVNITNGYMVQDVQGHVITSADVGDEATYWHSTDGSTWTQTTNLDLGVTYNFYLATDSAGTNGKADGQLYEIESIANANGLDHHLEITMLNKKV
jgi:hypothetical protein